MKGSSNDTKTCIDAGVKNGSFGYSNAAKESRADMEDLYNDEGASIDYTVCDEECGYCGHCRLSSGR